MGRPFLISWLSAALLVGCGPTEVTLDGGASSDASTGPAGRIVVESETTVTLMYGQSSEVLLQYLEGRAPRSGVELHFALSGNANDADLMSLEAVTDSEGRASTMLVAGTVGSAFRLRVSAERAPPAFVDVSVSDAGFGAIGVRANYAGARAENVRRVVTVYAEVDCDPAGGYPASAVARQLTLEDDEETDVVFNTLPAGLSYTVVGTVEGSTGVTLATACASGVEVVADEVTPVRLVFADAALSPSGTYELELELGADAFSSIAARGIDAGVAMSVRSADHFLDALEQALRDRGLMSDADRLAARRMDGEPARVLGEQLTAASADSVEGLRLFFERLLELLAKVRIGGPLELGVDDSGPPMDSVATGTWQALTLDVGAPAAPDGPPPIPLDLMMTGLEPAPVLAVSWLPDTDELEIGSLVIALPLEALVSATIDAASVDIASAPGAELREAAGCGVLTSWVAADPMLAPICDAACVDVVCSSALDEVLDAAQAGVLADSSLDEITLRGWLDAFDDDGDLSVDRLGGMLSGTWASTGTGPSVDAYGTVAGTRVRTAD